MPGGGMLPKARNPYRDGRASYGKHTVGAATALIGIAVPDPPQRVRTGGPEAVAARLHTSDRESRLLEGDPQVVRMAGGGQRIAQADEPVLVQGEEALVEGLHPVVLALGDDLIELVRLARVPDLVGPPGGGTE